MRNLEKEVINLGGMSTEAIKKKKNDLLSDIGLSVRSIYSLVHSVDAKELLSYVSSMYTMSGLSNGLIGSQNKENVFRSLQIEYIQSMLISKEPSIVIEKNLDKRTYDKIFKKIDLLCEKLFTDFELLTFVRGTEFLKNGRYEEEFVLALVELQSFYLVRGSRYQHNELVLLTELLEPHTSKFQELFGLSSFDIVEGARYLQYQLSQQKADNNVEFLELCQIGMNDPESSRNNEEFLAMYHQSFDKVMGLGAYFIDDAQVWNKKIISDLTSDLFSNETFMMNTSFPGDIYSVLPIVESPFIRIEEKIYCLSYYNLFDHLYRNLRRIVIKHDPSYSEQWNIKQSEVSEEFVAEIFSELLPFAYVYTNNFYKISGKGNSAENDLIVISDDILFVIEVKGSSFPLNSVMNDEDANISSFKKLVEEADRQSQRLIDLLNKNEEIIIYDKSWKEKLTLLKSDYRYIYPFSISIADINEMASKAEKLPFFNSNINSICLSIDDLLLYKDYFNNYLKFLHFVKHRYFALDIQNLHVNDEIDHLGLYIEHNYYSLTLNNIQSDKVFLEAYRDKLDEFFQSKYFPEMKVPKPEQILPIRINQILEFLNHNKKEYSNLLSDYILDLDDEARSDFSNLIDYIIEKQRKNKRMASAVQYGEITVVLYVYEEGIEKIDKTHMEKYNQYILHSSDSENLLALNLNLKSTKIEVSRIDNFSKSTLKFSKSQLDSLTDYMEPFLKGGEKF